MQSFFAVIGCSLVFMTLQIQSHLLVRATHYKNCHHLEKSFQWYKMLQTAWLAEQIKSYPSAVFFIF